MLNNRFWIWNVRIKQLFLLTEYCCAFGLASVGLWSCAAGWLRSWWPMTGCSAQGTACGGLESCPGPPSLVQTSAWRRWARVCLRIRSDFASTRHFSPAKVPLKSFWSLLMKDLCLCWAWCPAFESLMVSCWESCRRTYLKVSFLKILCSRSSCCLEMGFVWADDRRCYPNC